MSKHIKSFLKYFIQKKKKSKKLISRISNHLCQRPSNGEQQSLHCTEISIMAQITVLPGQRGEGGAGGGGGAESRLPDNSRSAWESHRHLWEVTVDCCEE